MGISNNIPLKGKIIPHFNMEEFPLKKKKMRASEFLLLNKTNEQNYKNKLKKALN